MSNAASSQRRRKSIRPRRERAAQNTMRTLIAKTIRLSSRSMFAVASLLRIVFLRLKYPGLYIDFETRIERGCKIVCVDGGRMSITNSFISSGTHLFADSNGVLEVTGTFIGRNCVVVAKRHIEIEDGCAIAEMVVIRDQNHRSDFNLSEAARFNFDVGEIRIGRSVWIGAKATILKGVHVGDRAILAASAVVTKNVPSDEVWGGIPATLIKTR